MSVKMKFGSKDIPFVYKGDKLVYPNPIKDGLLLWYDFRGMRNTDTNKEVAKDLSGNGSDGTLTNFNFTEESGYKDNTLVFDGVDDSLTIPELALDETAMTVMHDGKLYAYEDDKVIKVKKYSEDDSAELEGLEVGGRNLIVNSDDLKPSSSNANVTVSKVTDGSFNNVFKSETKVAGASSYFTTIHQQVSEEPKVGQQATLSLLVRGVVFEGLSNDLNIYYNSGTKNQTMVGISEEYQWLSVTFDVYSESTRFHFYPQNFSELYIARAKLEIGTTATGWSPAPEDFQTTSLSPSSLSNLQLYNRPLRKDELLHNAESKGLKKLKPGVIVQDGLLLHYDFSHESNTSEYKDKAFDYSGNGNHGKLQNFNFTEESGYVGNKLKFDGVDDEITTPPRLIGGTESYTISLIIDIKSQLNRLNGYFMMGTGIGRVWIRSVENQLSANTYFGKSEYDFSTTISNNMLDLGVAHITLLLDRKGKQTSYLNGSIVSEKDISEAFDIPTHFGEIRIGNQSSYSPPNADYFDVKIYNRVLTPEEIAHNYAIEKEKFDITEGEM